MPFSRVGLSAELLRAVRDLGYETMTPVQREAIPIALQGRDLLAGAQTGTGKTAGFALPILQRLHDTDPGGRRRHVRALVLTPTRELAAQVEASFRSYGRHLPFRTAVVYGGVAFGPQASKLRRGVHVVVATPGRLLDHLGQGTIDLRSVDTLVLDEADRMLDMGFIRDIRTILGTLPSRRHNMLFSATFSPEIRALADSFLRSPAEIQIAGRNSAAELVSHVAHPVDRLRKRELLAHMIESEDWRQVLVFTRTKHGADRLSRQLSRDGLSAAAIHGNKSQGARTRVLADFKDGRVRILVATDIAARGLDIARLPHVVNFDLPLVPEDYVHRIGRTGRAGLDGRAASLVSVDENGLLHGIERLMGRTIERVVVPGFEPSRTHEAPDPAPVRGYRPGRTGRSGRQRAGTQLRSERWGRRP